MRLAEQGPAPVRTAEHAHGREELLRLKLP